MPTSRNVNSLLAVTPGIAATTGRPGDSAPRASVGGIGVFCNRRQRFNVGDTGTFANVGGATALTRQSRPGPRAGRRPGNQRRRIRPDRQADRRLHGRHRQRQEVNIGSRALGESETGGSRSTSCRRPAATASPVTTTRPTPPRNGSRPTTRRIRVFPPRSSR